MNWGFEDGIAAALLIGGAAVAAWLIFKLIYRVTMRMILLAVVLIAALAIWAQLAVGVF